MSSSEEQEGGEGQPAQEPTDRWLGGKGPGHIDVGVQYTIQGNGDISTSWQVDASKAIPSKLPMFMYRSVPPPPPLPPPQSTHLPLAPLPSPQTLHVTGRAQALALSCVYSLGNKVDGHDH